MSSLYCPYVHIINTHYIICSMLGVDSSRIRIIPVKIVTAIKITIITYLKKDTKKTN